MRKELVNRVTIEDIVKLTPHIQQMFFDADFREHGKSTMHTAIRTENPEFQG